MSIYRNDDVLITDLMDRIDKLENQDVPTLTPLVPGRPHRVVTTV